MWHTGRHLHLKNFPMVKGSFNPMTFHPSNCSLKIWESIKTLTLKMRVHLGVCGFIFSHSRTLPGM
jgi:hypothetical protein